MVITDLWKLNGNCGKWKLNEHYLPYICYTHETSSQNFQLSKLSSLQILPHNDTNTHSCSNQLTKTKTFIYCTYYWSILTSHSRFRKIYNPRSKTYLDLEKKMIPNGFCNRSKAYNHKKIPTLPRNLRLGWRESIHSNIFELES